MSLSKSWRSEVGADVEQPSYKVHTCTPLFSACKSSQASFPVQVHHSLLKYTISFFKYVILCSSTSFPVQVHHSLVDYIIPYFKYSIPYSNTAFPISSTSFPVQLHHSLSKHILHRTTSPLLHRTLCWTALTDRLHPLSHPPHCQQSLFLSCLPVFTNVRTFCRGLCLPHCLYSSLCMHCRPPQGVGLNKVEATPGRLHHLRLPASPSRFWSNYKKYVLMLPHKRGIAQHLKNTKPALFVLLQYTCV